MADANKRKKAAYFAKNAKKARTQFSLQPGVKGFLATCNFREKDCVREAINILNEFADKIYGEDKSTISNIKPQNKKIVFKDSDDESEEKEDDDIEEKEDDDIEEKEDDDIEAALAKEVDALKQERQSHPNKRRFQVIQSGADNCVFIRTTVEDPVCVVEAILKDIESQSKQKTRFLLRLLPIEITCKAWPDDIKTASSKLLDKYFKGEPRTFCVVFKRRNNGNVLRDELIQDLANDIKLRNPLHRADMKQPDLAVIVEVIRNICCMAIVPKYFYYRKYNLIEVAKLKESNTQKEQILVQEDTTVVKSESSADISVPCTEDSLKNLVSIEKTSEVSGTESCQTPSGEADEK